MRVDLYTPDSVRVWLAFEDSADEDIDPGMVAEEAIGECPEWLDDELAQMGWEGIIEPGYRTCESGEGWIFADRWTTWSLKHGLVPGQAFCLQIEKPYIYRCSYEYEEYDVEWAYELVDVEPLSNAEKVKRLEAWLSGHRAYKVAAVKAMRELKKKRHEDVGAMFLQWGTYWAKHSYYDEMSLPDGRSVKLCTRHTQVEGVFKHSMSALAVGRSDGGNRDEALKALLGQIAEADLSLTPDQVSALPVRW